MIETLATALPAEQARVREVLWIYKGLGKAGRLGAFVIEQHLCAADTAVMSGDPVAMLKAYQALKGVQ